MRQLVVAGWLLWGSFEGESGGLPLSLLICCWCPGAYWLRRGRCRSSHWSSASCMRNSMPQTRDVHGSRSGKLLVVSTVAWEYLDLICVFVLFLLLSELWLVVLYFGGYLLKIQCHYLAFKPSSFGCAHSRHFMCALFFSFFINFISLTSTYHTHTLLTQTFFYISSCPLVIVAPIFRCRIDQLLWGQLPFRCTAPRDTCHGHHVTLSKRIWIK